MSHFSYLVFPEYKNRISDKVIVKCLDLVEGIVNFSRGKNLSSEEVKKITSKLGEKMSGSILYPGGASTLFAWSFVIHQFANIIIKPYYNRQITQLIVHYLIYQDFRNEFRKLSFEAGGEIYRLAIPASIGIANIKTFEHSFPTLMTTEIVGETIKSQPILIGKISSLVRKLGYQGIICDPYPSNWKVVPMNGEKFVFYIDLLSSNTIRDINRRMSELVKNLD
ncbi:MAG: hypothetical protein ACTSW1_12690 [Candidatus Hodarchaeales archaeon]